MADHCVSHRSFSVSVCAVKSTMCIYLYMFLVMMWSHYTAVTGQHQVIGSQDILVKVGDEVILPCRIEPPVNMGRKTVEWSRPDLKPYLINLLQDGDYKHGEELNPLYKDRTSLFPEKLPNGNISLKLSRVKLSDEGTYRCFAPRLNIYTLIQLLVGNVSQPVISSNGPTDGGLSLTCDSGCWYPQPEMSWLDRDENNITAEPSVTHRPSPHCYIVQRNVTVREAKNVTCRVHLTHINYTVETQRYISEDMIHTEKGSTVAVIRWIIKVIIIILVAAVLGYLYWKKNHPYLITNDEELRIVMVGKTGAGKSATANTILGSEAFKSTFSPDSVTLSCNKASGVVDGRKVSVIDTPGLFDTGFSHTETIKEVRNCISCAAPGPHVFLAVITLGRFTEEEKNVVAKIQLAFGQSSAKYTMILFTHGDKLKGQTIDEFVNESPDLQELISKYSGFYHVLENESKDLSQVIELLEKINQMVEKNGGSHYTNQMFQEEVRRQVVFKPEEVHLWGHPSSPAPSPVQALVLLFCTPPTDDDPRLILKVLLLPRNTVISEVMRERRKLNGEEIYFGNPPCKLIPNQEYTLYTSPQDDSITIQPNKAIFTVDEALHHYVATFEVVLKHRLSSVSLLLIDSKTSVCRWQRGVDLSGLHRQVYNTTALRKQQVQRTLTLPPEDRLFSIRSRFINCVSDPVLNNLLDKLLEKGMIIKEEYDEACVEPVKHEKARFVIDTVRRKGPATSSSMILILCETDPLLSEDLGLM